MKIHEVAKLTGITVRTLQYYDKIGLLKPQELTEANYRIYGQKELELLQQILFFKELDFSLAEIKEIMKNPSYQKNEALQKQKELLTQKRERIDGLIHLIEKTLEGATTMSFEEFDTTKIEEQKQKYAKEVKERWGTTDAYAQSEEKTKHYDQQKWAMVNEDCARILKEFADCRMLSPEDPKVQELVKAWQEYITANFYDCTNEILAGLGMMYTADERFTKNMDQYGEGTAALMQKAIEVYCKK